MGAACVSCHDCCTSHSHDASDTAMNRGRKNVHPSEHAYADRLTAGGGAGANNDTVASDSDTESDLQPPSSNNASKAKKSSKSKKTKRKKSRSRSTSRSATPSASASASASSVSVSVSSAEPAFETKFGEDMGIDCREIASAFDELSKKKRKKLWKACMRVVDKKKKNGDGFFQSLSISIFDRSTVKREITADDDEKEKKQKKNSKNSKNSKNTKNNKATKDDAAMITSVTKSNIYTLLYGMTSFALKARYGKFKTKPKQPLVKKLTLAICAKLIRADQQLAKDAEVDVSAFSQFPLTEKHYERHFGQYLREIHADIAAEEEAERVREQSEVARRLIMGIDSSNKKDK